jgi:two-component system nitrogen regulation sensor histidine kinase GlnL
MDEKNTDQIQNDLTLPSFEVILNNLSDGILLLGDENQIIYVNACFENLFSQSRKNLIGHNLSDFFPMGSQVLALVEQAIIDNISLTEFEISFLDGRGERSKADIFISHIFDEKKYLILTFQEKKFTKKFQNQFKREGAARTVVGMASMLAHEIKNPLSGIRGAAQLLGYDLSEDDQKLTKVIIEETDRICALVDQMEVFSEHLPIRQDGVNIHSVLEHVKQLAQNGFASHIKFKEQYDPSLPDTIGDRSKLIQVFLNLIKNAAEACRQDGEIIITTAYRHGVRILSSDGKSKVHLPLEISIIDNGEGFPDDIESLLFDPFITTKENGSGLGLPLVSKIINDHGGMVEYERLGDKTIFRILLRNI